MSPDCSDCDHWDEPAGDAGGPLAQLRADRAGHARGEHGR